MCTPNIIIIIHTECALLVSDPGLFPDRECWEDRETVENQETALWSYLASLDISEWRCISFNGIIFAQCDYWCMLNESMHQWSHHTCMYMYSGPSLKDIPIERTQILGSRYYECMWCSLSSEDTSLTGQNCLAEGVSLLEGDYCILVSTIDPHYNLHYKAHLLIA